MKNQLPDVLPINYKQYRKHVGRWVSADCDPENGPNHFKILDVPDFGSCNSCKVCHYKTPCNNSFEKKYNSLKGQTQSLSRQAKAGDPMVSQNKIKQCGGTGSCTYIPCGFGEKPVEHGRRPEFKQWYMTNPQGYGPGTPPGYPTIDYDSWTAPGLLDKAFTDS